MLHKKRQPSEPERKIEKLVPAKIGSVEPLNRVGDLYLAGQPILFDFVLAKEGGIRTVINLRHNREIEGFDEKSVVEDAGLTYQHLPWNGEDELTDAIFDRTRELLRTAQRPVLVHCSSANRAAAVWIPWRVIDEGVEIEVAVKEANRAGLKKSSYEQKARDYIQRIQRSGGETASKSKP